MCPYNIVLKQGGDYIVLSPRYVNKQSTPTTTPVARIYLLLRHPRLHLKSIRFFVRS